MSMKVINFILLTVYLGWPINVLGRNGKRPFICKVNSGQDLLQAMLSHSDIGIRSFVLSEYRRWPHGIIPYELDSSFSNNQVNMIENIIKMFSTHSCVKWIPHNQENDYVYIKHVFKKGQCDSIVGRRGKMQLLNLNDDCFDVNNGYQGAIAHEMLHAMGFIHEQQRIDRNCFVKVTAQIAEEKSVDYGIKEDTDFQFPYDFGSIMHYGESEFMKSYKGEKMGNYEGALTKMDKIKLNYMYCGGRTFCELDYDECIKFREAQDQCRRKS